NKANVLKYGIVDQKDKDKIVSSIPIDISGGSIAKNTLMMFDLIANLDWTRPVYFSGGSYNDSDYLWMKDYLELDGLVYKLVPIKTPVDPDNPYDMGRILPDKMYDIVMNWHWGNSGDPDMYYDPETRRNSVAYRGTMARTVEKWSDHKENKKAEENIEMALAKLPVDKLGYYGLITPFMEGYYKIGEKDKARQLFKSLSEKYQQRLNYFAGLDMDEQRYYGQEIIANIQRYRELVDITILNDSETIGQQKAEEYNHYVEAFTAGQPGFNQLEVDSPKEEAQKRPSDSGSIERPQLPP